MNESAKFDAETVQDALEHQRNTANIFTDILQNKATMEYLALADQWRKEYAAYFIANNEAYNLKAKVEHATEEWQAQEHVANNKYAACKATFDAMRKLVEEQVNK